MELERIAFEYAPIGLALTENRIMKQVNVMFAEMFDADVGYFADRSLRELYPTQDDFDRIAVVGVEGMRESGRYDDERVMRRLNGDQFWCRVRGQSLTPEDPFQRAIWSFSDLSEMRPVVQMTNREKDVAALTCKGLSSKEIGRELGVSHRTVEIYRARLMKKFEARKTAELVSKLSGMPI